MTLDKTIIFRYLTMFALGSLLSAQVNTEALRKGDLSPGFHTAFDLDLGVIAGNSKLLNIDGTLRFDYRKAKTHTFLVSNRHLSQTNSLFLNKGFIHIRHTKSLHGNLSIEVFVQKEFDQFIRLKDRNLAGTGIRYRLFETIAQKKDTPILKFFLGLGFMWEQEFIRDAKDPVDSLKNLLRSTNYLVIRWKPDERILFQSIVYFQPAVRQLNDFRVLFDGGLTYILTRKLSVTTKINSRYDHDPPTGLNLEKYDVGLTSGLAYIF